MENEKECHRGKVRGAGKEKSVCFTRQGLKKKKDVETRNEDERGSRIDEGG